MVNDYIISTRIRLARNFSGVPFSSKMTAGQASVIAGKVNEALGDGYKTYSIAALGEVESGTLVEKHLISKELLASPFGSVIVSDDEEISVMLCEEDHVRLQAIKKGLCLDETYAAADAVDDRIAAAAKYSFDERLGYLTACPTNLGTGMRASIMMFLPALTLTDMLMPNMNRPGMSNITLRGVYGEGSDALGYIYQVSNRRTLGLTESELLRQVRAAALMLCEAEERARDYLIEERESELKDEILRSVGIARYAYKLSNREAVKLSSFIKLGAYYGLVTISSPDDVTELMTSVQTYGLVSSADRQLVTAEEIDIYRAETVRAALNRIII